MELSIFLQTWGFNALFYAMLIIATQMFLWKQAQRRHFPLRLLLVAALGFALTSLLRLLVPPSNLSNVLTYSAAMLSMIGVSFICFDVSIGEAIFCAVAGYSAQFVQSICSELFTRLFLLQGVPQVLCQLASAAVAYPILYYFFGRKMKKGQNFDLNKWSLLLLLFGAVLIEIIICYNLRLEWRVNNAPVYLLCDCGMLMLCSIFILITQFSLLLRQNLQDELNVIYQMWHKDQNQYQISQDTIELINRKCHDMRHQIRTIGRSANIDSHALAEMEESIGIYDAIYNTGCRALDIILTEKSLFCQKRDISISCIADGGALSFISDADIYSLFGNLLENAINAVMELEKDRRVISLTVKQRGELLSVNSHNCYSGEITLRNGVPQTTSADAANHGFGVKSMAAIAEKYGGTVSFSVRDGVFNINMLFPTGVQPTAQVMSGRR